MTDRCEPPEGAEDGSWWWMSYRVMPRRLVPMKWHDGEWWDDDGEVGSPQELARDGWSVNCRITLPDEVDALRAEVARLRAIEARITDGAWLAEASSAVTGAWQAAPEGEGVSGGEYFAEVAAALVFREGLKADEAVAKAIGEHGTYGVPRTYELIRRDELARLRADLARLVEALERVAGLHFPGRRSVLDCRIIATAALAATKEPRATHVAHVEICPVCGCTPDKNDLDNCNGKGPVSCPYTE